MKTVTLDVNGQRLSATVSARTQLAELLRDHFNFTGTHLGCEHGVCGACTVLVNGTPVRSCISYAHANDGASVTTVEGLADDPIAARLREGFSRHHALQCGFCTPGMLITARDIVARGAANDEAAIRRELSGNLCRCTGYMGIVAAVAEAAQVSHAPPDDDEAAEPAVEATSVASAAAFAPFQIDPKYQTAQTENTGSGLRIDPHDGWTSFRRTIAIPEPADQVWALFTDLRRVAECIPGVRLTHVMGDHFQGESAISFGPVTAAFDGQGTRRLDPTRRTGSIIGHGVDPNGQASLEVRFEFALHETGDAGDLQTTLDLGIRFRIQGHLAQFNRAELVESFADLILGEFASNCERVLRGEEVHNVTGLSGIGLLWRASLAWLSKKLRPG